VSHSTIKIMLVEDNPRYREVVALSLQGVSDLELCSQFGTAEIALRTIRNLPPPDRPQVVLLDLRLPSMDGLVALPHFLESVPDGKVIILTQSDDEADVLRAISLGASGYLLKTCTADQIAESIRSVWSGGAPLDPGVARYVLKQAKLNLPKAGAETLLTQRQLEILTFLGEGLVKKEIAARLGIGYATVDEHIANIYLRLRVHNAAAAVNRAHSLGLLKSDAR
jgi:DNA-binding NarL/FixJ family response regulator